MKRRMAPVLFGMLLLLAQVLQGVTADAMTFTTGAGDPDSLAVAAAQHCGSGHLAPAALDPQPPAHPHCPFCASGACRMAHAPALPLVLVVAARPLPPTYATTLQLDERLDARISRILRPPR